jgi:hypothetical protein
MFATLAVLLTGCGRPVGSLSGKVTYQNKPLKGGSVAFVSTDGGRSFSAALSEEGVYTIPDLQGGEYKVCVETDSHKPPKQYGGGFNDRPPAKGKFGPPPGAPVPEGYTPSDPSAAARSGKNYVPIPPHYASPEKTDLTYKFDGGSETYNIDLK